MRHKTELQLVRPLFQNNIRLKLNCPNLMPEEITKIVSCQTQCPFIIKAELFFFIEKIAK